MKRLSLYIFYALLAYMPLHIFLSTWLGTAFDGLVIARILKDIVLFVGFLLALAFSVRQPWFRHLLGDKLTRLILLYAGLTVLLALVKPTDQDAEILGVVYNLRYLLFFIYAVLLAHLFGRDQLRWTSVRIVLASACLVVAFGILQYLVMPDDFLRQYGYSRSNGVLPAFFIDDKPDLERIMSTIRDPNSLGSYLIIIAPLAAAAMFVRKSKRSKLPPAFLLAGSTLALWFTFSRSAWIGFALAMVTFLFLTDSGFKIVLRKRTRTVMTMVLVAVVIMLGTLAVFRKNYFVQNAVFHADERTVLEDPNELRIKFWRESIEDIAADPIGSGPGTAGLASIRNNVQGVELNENYYLQIASEVGLIGLGLFVAILAIIGWRLLELRLDSYVACALLAAFVGLLFTNFLVHIWSNEAVAYTWWGLAGLAVSRISHNTKSKR